MPTLASFIPPTNLEATEGAELFFTVLMAVTVFGACAWALRRREFVLPILCAAAAVSSLVEPVYDYLGHVWWTSDLATSFTVFDGRVFSPTIFPLGYAMWIGLGSYAAFRLFERRPGRSKLLKSFALLALCEPALELPWLATNLFEYYGDQPYRVLGYSLVWDGVNTGAIAIIGATLLWMTQGGHLRGRGVALTALLPLGIIGWYFASAWPTWTAMHADAPAGVIWAAATLTIAINAITVSVIADRVSRTTAQHVPPVAHDGRVASASRPPSRDHSPVSTA